MVRLLIVSRAFRCLQMLRAPRHSRARFFFTIILPTSFLFFLTFHVLWKPYEYDLPPSKMELSIPYSGMAFGDTKQRATPQLELTTAFVHTFSPELENTIQQRFDPEKTADFSPMSPALIDVEGGKTILVARINVFHKPGVIRRSGGTLRKWQENLIFTRLLDRSFRPQDAGRFIFVPGLQGKYDGPSDPRIFSFKNRLYLTFDMLNGWNDYHHFYMWDYTEERLIKFRIFENGKELPLQDWEKNWSPLVLDGELYFIYGLDPLVVLKCNTSGLCDVVYRQKVDPNRRIHHYLRGGTPYVVYKFPYFITFAHSHTHCDGDKRMYRAHFVVLSVEPTFRIVYVSDSLQFHPKVMGRRALPFFFPCFDSYVFPVSINLRGQDIVDFGAHLNDNESIVLRVQGIKRTFDQVIVEDTDLDPTTGPKPGVVQDYLGNITAIECKNLMGQTNKRIERSHH